MVFRPGALLRTWAVPGEQEGYNYIPVSELLALGGLLTSLYFGAKLDSKTDDGPALANMLASAGYVRPATGTSLIATSVPINASSTALLGTPRLAKLLASDSLGNGVGIFAVGASGLVSTLYVSGLDLTLPSTANQLRGFDLRTVDDAFLSSIFINALNSGSYGVLQRDANYNRLTVALFDIISQADSIILKPNLSAPTSNTYQGKDALIAIGRMRGQGTPTGPALSLDGNFINAIMLGVQAVDRSGGTNCFGVALANDGADFTKARGVILGLSGIRNTVPNENFHSEDAIRGMQLIGNNLLDGKRGVETIMTAQGVPQLVNYAFLFIDTQQFSGLRVVDSGSGVTNWEGINVIGNLIRNWGTDTASKALELGGPNGHKANILANMILDGKDDAISVRSEGLDGAGRGGGINIDYNHVEGNTGAALNITAVNANAKIRVGSGNTFRSIGGLFSAGSLRPNIVGDQRRVSEPITAGAFTAQDVVFFVARRPGALTGVDMVYLQANNSTIAGIFELHRFTPGTSTDTLMGQHVTPITAAAAYTTLSFNANFNLAGCQFAAGDVVYGRKTTAGDGTYRYAVQVEYFEYFG